MKRDPHRHWYGTVLIKVKVNTTHSCQKDKLEYHQQHKEVPGSVFTVL